MTAKEQKKAAAEFAAKWLGRGYEKGECQKFWRGLLHDVFGIADPDDWLQYEIPVATGYVDAYISRTKVLIEQKGFEHGLADKAAMKQAMMYVGAMPDTMPVRYVVLSNFQEFWIYDKHAPEMKPVKVALRDLPRKLGQLSFLTELQRPVPVVRDVTVVDKRAGELVGRLYSALLRSYVGEVDDRTLESLNMLCVRLVFCAYAEDAGVFPKRDQFVDYMRRYDAESFRDRLAQLFRMLNTEYADRDPEDIPDLLDFPYVGSGLFDDESIRIPRFTEETRALLLDCLSVGFRPHRGLAAMPSANTEFTEHGAEMRGHRGRRGEERFVRLCVRRRHWVLRRQLNALSRIRSGRLRCFDIITSRKETKWQFANL